MKETNWLSKEAVKITDRRRVVKYNGENEEARRVNVDFQKQSRRDKEASLNARCKEIEENNRKGITREFIKEIKCITGKFNASFENIRSSTQKDITKNNGIKKRQKEHSENLFLTDSVRNITFVESEFDEYEREEDKVKYLDWIKKETAMTAQACITHRSQIRKRRT